MTRKTNTCGKSIWKKSSWKTRKKVPVSLWPRGHPAPFFSCTSLFVLLKYVLIWFYVYTSIYILTKNMEILKKYRKQDIRNHHVRGATLSRFLLVFFFSNFSIALCIQSHKLCICPAPRRRSSGGKMEPQPWKIHGSHWVSLELPSLLAFLFKSLWLEICYLQPKSS